MPSLIFSRKKRGGEREKKKKKKKGGQERKGVAADAVLPFSERRERRSMFDKERGKDGEKEKREKGGKGGRKGKEEKASFVPTFALLNIKRVREKRGKIEKKRKPVIKS